MINNNTAHNINNSKNNEEEKLKNKYSSNNNNNDDNDNSKNNEEEKMINNNTAHNINNDNSKNKKRGEDEKQVQQQQQQQQQPRHDIYIPWEDEQDLLMNSGEDFKEREANQEKEQTKSVQDSACDWEQLESNENSANEENQARDRLDQVEDDLRAIEQEIHSLNQRKKNLHDEKRELKNRLHTMTVAPPRFSQRNWSQNFPWSDRVDRLLRERFDIPSLRSIQRKAINATLSQRDVRIVSLP